MFSSVKVSSGAVLVLLLCVSVQATPVSFPDSQPQSYQKDSVATQPEPSNITPPPPEAPIAPTDSGNEDLDGPTVAEVIESVPQIWAGIQNYINTAVSSYASNETVAAAGNATNQPPPQFNQILGLVDGFLAATNNFAQQLLQPDEPETAEPTDAESGTVVPDNNV